MRKGHFRWHKKRQFCSQKKAFLQARKGHGGSEKEHGGSKKRHGATKKGMAPQKKGMAQRHAKYTWGNRYRTYREMDLGLKSNMKGLTSLGSNS